jgi:carbon storage regulator
VVQHSLLPGNPTDKEKDNFMLVLSRDMNEVVMIGESIKVIVLNINGNTVRLGFQAPLSVPIHREEIFYRINGQVKNLHQGLQQEKFSQSIRKSPCLYRP